MFPVLISIFTFMTAAFPLLFIAWLWKGKFISRGDWALKVFTAASVVLFFLLAGTWAFLSVWLKYALAALFALAVVKTFPRLEDRTIFGRKSRARATYKGRLVFLGVFIVLDFLAVKGRFHAGEPLELSFPLKDGRYYVIQGGASPVLNPFHRYGPSEAYALDIVKLNLLGNRAGGVFPPELHGYRVFGEVIYSPCSGKVAGAVDGLPDNPPRAPEKDSRAGNHIVLECGDASILLAHLLNGSLKVTKGQSVKENQVIGRVGNSGNTSEPHLHISAHRKDEPGKALPLTFRGEFLVMNGSFRN